MNEGWLNQEIGNKAKRAFPTADINEPDSDNSVKGRAKKIRRAFFPSLILRLSLFSKLVKTSQRVHCYS